MSLENIVKQLDESIEVLENTVASNSAIIEETDANKMAHHIVAYVLERAEPGYDPAKLGSAMVQGAYIGEAESGGVLANPVINFLKSMLEGAELALTEACAAEPIYLDPVDHAVKYMLAHNKWPEGASALVIARAKVKLDQMQDK